MAGVMDALFGGKKKEAKPQGEAMNTIMGGLGGTLSTAELVKARAEYDQYRVGVETGGGDRLTFEEWVQREYKPKK